jgi:hypothetical protein
VRRLSSLVKVNVERIGLDINKYRAGADMFDGELLLNSPSAMRGGENGRKVTFGHKRLGKVTADEPPRSGYQYRIPDYGYKYWPKSELNWLWVNGWSVNRLTTSLHAFSASGHCP